MELILSSFIVLILALLYWKNKKIYSYWTERNIKTLPVVPLLGSYGAILKQNDHFAIVMKKLYDQYPNEKYIGGFKGSSPELIVRDPDIIKSILTKDFNHFIDRGMVLDCEGEILGKHLFHMNGEKWRTLRQKLSPTFTSSKMKKMFPLVLECGELLEANIKENLLESNEMEIKDMMAKFTTDTIGSCAFGLQMNSLQDKDSPFPEMGKKIFATSKWNTFLRFIALIIPELFTIFSIKIHIYEKEIEDFFTNLVIKLMDSRKGKAHRNDFVDLMLELREKGSIEVNNNNGSEKENFDITDTVITSQLVLFFAAGYETSSTTMSYALRELAFKPDLLKKVQNEIDTVIHKHDGKLTYNAVQEMEYLDMVIDETLRMYPPLPFLNRQCTIAYKIPGTNYVIDKGVRVLIPILGLQWDPKYFPKPDEFNPERFSKENKNLIHPFSYMPFGEGPRICIGARFGKLQTATGLISFLRKFSVETSSKTPVKVEMKKSAMILQSCGGIPLRITPRIQRNVVY